MKATILLLIAIFIGNIAFAGVSTSPCPLKAGGKLQTRKPNSHNGLMPGQFQTVKSEPQSVQSADSKP